ncbi:hypothetical protein Glove_85g16 [Diversispora epigaea]|uniref:Uncharacterized protein n=1 Tax=Diversispora epigaea TaxID=1348612 RepID=A0A397JGR5_9GLOM|nr:hypothetical protein Glove_85g16 [Diversispora epigaea]
MKDPSLISFLKWRASNLALKDCAQEHGTFKYLPKSILKDDKNNIHTQKDIKYFSEVKMFWNDLRDQNLRQDIEYVKAHNEPRINAILERDSDLSEGQNKSSIKSEINHEEIKISKQVIHPYKQKLKFSERKISLASAKRKDKKRDSQQSNIIIDDDEDDLEFMQNIELIEKDPVPAEQVSKEDCGTSPIGSNDNNAQNQSANQLSIDKNNDTIQTCNCS